MSTHQTHMGRILEASPTLEVARDLGLGVRRAGDVYFALCPNPEHEGFPVECQIIPAHDVFCCLACGRGGNAFNLVQLVKGLGASDAYEYLEKRAGLARVAPVGAGEEAAR